MHHQLAQLNVARLVAPLDDPAVADYVAALEPMNALAEHAPGFVWRWIRGQDQGENPFGDDMLVNLSVWESLAAMRSYVYSGAHAGIMRRRRDWMLPHDGPYQVCWWVEAGDRPSLVEAAARLRRLAEEGPGPLAFPPGQPYDVHGLPVPAGPKPAPARGGR